MRTWHEGRTCASQKFLLTPTTSYSGQKGHWSGVLEWTPRGFCVFLLDSYPEPESTFCEKTDPYTEWLFNFCGNRSLRGHFLKPEVARITFLDSDSAPVPKLLNPDLGPAIFQIWESDSCSDSGYSHRSNFNLPMFLLKKWPHRLLLLPILKSDSRCGSMFFQIFDSGSEKKRRIPLESTPAIQICSHLWFFWLRLCTCFWLKDSCSDFEKFLNINSEFCLHSETFQVTHIKYIVFILPCFAFDRKQMNEVVTWLARLTAGLPAVRDGSGRFWSGFWVCRWGWTSGLLSWRYF